MVSTLRTTTRSAAIGGTAALLAFPCLVVAANLIQRNDYSAAREAVSNLALGQAGWLMTLAFLALGSGTLLVGVLVRRLIPGAIVGPVLLAAGACTTLLSAVFQTDAEGASSTLHGTIHIALGLGSFALVIASITACTVSFLRSRQRRGIGILSAVWAIAAFGAVVLTFVLPESMFGIGQRVFLAVAISWMLMICLAGIRDRTNLQRGPERSAASDFASPSGASAGRSS